MPWDALRKKNNAGRHDCNPCRNRPRSMPLSTWQAERTRGIFLRQADRRRIVVSRTSLDCLSKTRTGWSNLQTSESDDVGQMILTHHACLKWKERFPDLNLEKEWAKAKPCPPKVKKALRKSCPEHKQFMQPTFKGRYLLATDRVVFVVTPPEVVITVLRRPQ